MGDLNNIVAKVSDQTEQLQQATNKLITVKEAQQEHITKLQEQLATFQVQYDRQKQELAYLHGENRVLVKILDKQSSTEHRETAARIIKELELSDIQQIANYDRDPRDLQTLYQAVAVLTRGQTSPVENLNEMYNSEMLEILKDFDDNQTPIKALRQAYEYIQRPSLDPDYLSQKSKEAGSLCQWLISTVMHQRQVRHEEKQAKSKAKSKMR